VRTTGHGISAQRSLEQISGELRPRTAERVVAQLQPEIA
jgi:hypothetical protein